MKAYGWGDSRKSAYVETGGVVDRSWAANEQLGDGGRSAN